MVRYEELNRRLEKHQATDRGCLWLAVFSMKQMTLMTYHEMGRGQCAVLQASLATGGQILSTSWSGQPSCKKPRLAGYFLAATSSLKVALGPLHIVAR